MRTIYHYCVRTVSLFVLILVLTCCAVTLPIRDKATGLVVPDSIAEITTVDIAGIKNWLVIRGRNIHNPVLLFLHGGPGSPELPLLRHFNEPLEDEFVLVYWEQPGTCKSYSPDIRGSDLTVDKFVDYTKGIIDYIRARFGQDRVYVMGHSWGSALAVLTAKKYPEVLHAVIGVGQVVDIVAGEIASFRLALSRAREEKNETAISELAGLGDPPAYVSARDDSYDGFMTKRKWALYFGLALRGKRSYRHYERYYFDATEYTIFDLPAYIRGRRLTGRTLGRDVVNIDLTAQAPRLTVPVYFMMGRHDAISANADFDEYVERLSAPKKEVVWFEHSAHFPLFEEPSRFNAEVIRIMKQTENADTIAPPR
ncbi:MAG: alpha/beta fold hydrolase [Deltaproteobacteria bacterium]|nr:alpha/beta fold hydrolase [Candidatus Zymogenaceae bacterium]